MNDDLRRLRDEETKEHSVSDGSYRGTASAIARRVASERARYEWLRLPDRADTEDQPPLSNQEMTAWLDIVRRSHTQDATRARLDMRIPRSAELVAPADFHAAVASERSVAAAVEGKGQERVHPAYRPLYTLDPDRRTEIADRLRRLEGQRRTLALDRDAWLPTLVRDTVAGRPGRWDAIIASNRERLARIEALRDRVKERMVVIPDRRDRRTVRADVATALAHLDAGGRWKRLGLFTPRTLRGIDYLKDEVRVDGIGAAHSSRLRVARDYLAIELELNEVRRIWNGVGAPPLPEDRRQSLAVAAELCSDLECARRYAEECRALGRRDGGDNDADSGARLVEWRDRDMAGVDRRRRPRRPIPPSGPDGGCGRGAAQRFARQGRRLSGRRRSRQRCGPTRCERLPRGLRGDHLHRGRYAKTDESDAGSKTSSRLSFRGCQVALCRPPRMRPGMIVSRHGKTHGCGRSPTGGSEGVATRPISRISNGREPRSSRASDACSPRRPILRAWERFFARLSQSQTAALRGWLKAIQYMGKGKGKSGRLARLRRQAREYMDECREAIPVWIMPRYLVAEMVNLQPELYDVVIVDEASQLGIDSVFLFYIAKKMVVVGDDQQISPYDIGIPETTTAALQGLYLDGIPHQQAFSPRGSLYDNAFIRFGARNVVLREHFRCMPEIIQFSNDLCYAPNGTPLDPLRTYPADRLEPLMVRRVPDGYRMGNDHARNPPEADALVDQVIKCIADPRYADATMGVISLQGEAQARLIERKLLERVDPEVVEERRLLCGDAYAFQGDERDIMFLSMVAAEKDDNGERQRIGPLADAAARRRFNVAASRARDQIWLFHTVDSASLSPTCMRRCLLDYMLDRRRKPPEEHDQRFESDFERDVFQRITQRGFHVRAQVAVGDTTAHRYRIDLVVEGMQARLAVECDGDRWHGPERYEADMARQRDLERAGWRFVRIRGSAFYRNPDEALEPLWKELERMGISPDGAVDSEQLVEAADEDDCVPIRHAPPKEYETAELTWEFVANFFREYGCVMVEDLELKWYQESWGALMRAGLTNWTKFKDPDHGYEMLKLRAICLLAMYLGIYQQSTIGSGLDDFSGHPGISEYLSSLDVDDEVLWQIALVEGLMPYDMDEDMAKDADEEDAVDEDMWIIRDATMELIRKDNGPIYNVLKAHYGGTAALFVSLWNSRVPLHEMNLHDDVINSLSPDLDVVWMYVEEGMRTWEIDAPY